MTRWVALRAPDRVIGEVQKATRANAWLEAWVTFGSSVTSVQRREQWEQAQLQRRAKLQALATAPAVVLPSWAVEALLGAEVGPATGHHG